MTENRCIEVLKKMKHMFTATCAKIDENTALNMAVKAIEEIQQYRAIGLTPELIEAMQGHNIALINDLGEYQQIGTATEFKELKEKEERFDRNIKMFNEIGWEIRNKAISEFVKEIRDWQIDIQDNEHDADKFDFVFERIYEIAEEMRCKE